MSRVPRTKEEDEKLLTVITDHLLNRIKEENEALKTALATYEDAAKSKNTGDMEKYLKSFEEHHASSVALSEELKHAEEELRKLLGLTDEEWKPREEKWRKEMEEEEREKKGGKAQKGKSSGGVMTGKTRRRKGGFLPGPVARAMQKISSYGDDEPNKGITTKEGMIKHIKELRGTLGEFKNAAFGPLPTQGGRTTRRASTSGGDIVCHLLTIRNQVKLYHWQTGSFARHKATDDLTAALDTSIDAFVESYMGRYGRPKVSGGIKLHNFSEAAAKKFVAKEAKYLETELPRKIGKGDTDLLNLRDTILGDLTKVSYLFTLN